MWIDPDSAFLYVGWRHDCDPWWFNVFCKRLGTTDVSVLEIFKKNVEDLRRLMQEGRTPAIWIIPGDVREIDEIVPKDRFDFIFWDHGPEHISQEDLETTHRKLLDCTTNVLMYSCPWGVWEQGPEDHNEHEIHRNSIYEETFQRLDASVIDKTGAPNVENRGELVAYWFKRARTT